MDQTITYESVAEFLKNHPTLLLCLDFTKLRTLQKHMAHALKQLVCPQSAIHGWLGLVLLPMVYALLKSTPFLALVYLGNLAVYPHVKWYSTVHTYNSEHV
jgi:hypothetical protein